MPARLDPALAMDMDGDLDDPRLECDDILDITGTKYVVASSCVNGRSDRHIDVRAGTHRIPQLLQD